MSGILPTRKPMRPLDRYAGMNSGRKSFRGGGLIGSLIRPRGCNGGASLLDGSHPVSAHAERAARNGLAADTCGHLYAQQDPPRDALVRRAKDQERILDHRTRLFVESHRQVDVDDPVGRKVATELCLGGSKLRVGLYRGVDLHRPRALVVDPPVHDPAPWCTVSPERLGAKRGDAASNLAR